MFYRQGSWALFLLVSQPLLHAHDAAWPEAVVSGAERLQAHASVIDASGSWRSNRQDGPGALDFLVQNAPLCIVWSKTWAGELGSSVLYRVQRVDPTTIRVGYFVFWTTERPWGDNPQTHWILPSLAIDAVYTHFMFVLPGVQAAVYGQGDIEGAMVTYREDREKLRPVSIAADDGLHRRTAIDVREAVDDEGRVLLLNEVWSHQLGGRDALKALRAGAHRRCFEQGALRPLTRSIADAFRLGSSAHPLRARPAWGF